MASPLDLSLTHGQVAWALARGQQPTPLLIDQLRYLRQLGVPFSKHELGGGRGNRIRYGFDHLIELGVALFGLQRGMAPREVAGILVEYRAELRRCYRDILTTLPTAAFEAEWVKSRGAVVPIMEETLLRLHDRYSEPRVLRARRGGRVGLPEPARDHNRAVSGWRDQNPVPAHPPGDRARRLGARGARDQTRTTITAATESQGMS